MRIVDITSEVVHWDVKEFAGGKCVMLSPEEWEKLNRYINIHGLYLTIL